jgi:hypothetical protein
MRMFIRFATWCAGKLKNGLNGKRPIDVLKIPVWESETMVTGAFSVSIGCSQRSSGAFEERREAAFGTESP